MKLEADIKIGKKLRVIRKINDFSQESLAKKMGITFQQIQKYEKGNNRISASRLVKFAEVFGVSPMFFLDDLNDPEVLFSDTEFLIIREIKKMNQKSKQNLLTIVKNWK